MDLTKKASRQNITRGSRTSYICGITDETNELYEDYKMMTHSTVRQQKQVSEGLPHLYNKEERRQKIPDIPYTVTSL